MKRLQQRPNLLERYDKEMHRLVEARYAESLPQSIQTGIPGKIWYLPHHPVLNQNKPEKVRIVFDCAATYHDISLNSQVMQGLDLNNKLTGVLLWFRHHKIALMADIESMFHQVKVVPEDRDVLLFLWWMDGDYTQEPTTYRMTVHLFGGVWSPSCAGYALQWTFEDYRQDITEEVRNARHNFYVDDLLISIPSKDKAVEMTQQLRQLLEKGGFRLTKWICNDKSVLNTIPQMERATGVREINLKDGKLPSERALGILWNLETDELAVRIQTPQRQETKRGLLSMISSIYDPLGVIAPVLIKAKLIFQDECRRQAGWDEPLTEINKTLWKKWLDEWHGREEIRIPRSYWPDKTLPLRTSQIQHFCDASQQAYGIVSYLRLTDEGGHHHIAFLFGKAKLAPMRQQTIPRLELCAAVMAARTDRQLRQELGTEMVDSVFWTDSMAVLQYIRNTERRFHTFVANRVATICEHSDIRQWRHIRSNLNPADEASRGMWGSGLHEECRWIRGPAFLTLNEENWPTTTQAIPDIATNDPEVKKTSICLTTTKPEKDVDIIRTLREQQSSWHQLLKTIAWLRRFIQWCAARSKNTCNKGRLSAGEMEKARLTILQAMQMRHFRQEICTLKRESLLPLVQCIDWNLI